MRIAVIDLGTNTCNLLIAEVLNGNYSILHQGKKLVKLGDGKIRENEISEEATARAVTAFRAYKELIKKFEVDKVQALATSAVRTAGNKAKFLKEIGRESGCLVKLVSGKREAELIFKGVLLALKDLSEPSVILDIGGGSNELILARGKDVIWKESLPTGMSRVIHSFQLSDPISASELSQLQEYFSQHHQAAFTNCKKHRVNTLVGCSGAFDTIADMVDAVNPGAKVRVSQEISLKEFNRVYDRLIHSTHEERLAMKGVDHVRVDLIVPAVILIRKLIDEIGIKRIVQTDFALREGVLYEQMNKTVKV